MGFEEKKLNLNPSVAVFSAFFYSGVLSFAETMVTGIIPIILVFFFLKIQVKNFFKKLFFLNFFIVIVAITVYFQGGFERALELFLKINMILMFNLALFMKSFGYDIVRGLYGLKFPKKLLSLIYFSVKMNQILLEELGKINTTLKLRFFSPDTSFFTYEVFGNILGRLFVRSFQRAEALEESFCIRGFKDEIYLLVDYRLGARECLLLFSLIILLIERLV